MLRTPWFRRPVPLVAQCVVLVAFFACGGKVAFDGVPGTGGATGSTSTTQSATHVSSVGPITGVTTGSSEITCMNPPPPGTLNNCGGSAVSGSSGAPQCDVELCDAMGNTYGSSCQGDACICTRNGQTLCTCVLNGPGQFCTNDPSCCPWQ